MYKTLRFFILALFSICSSAHAEDIQTEPYPTEAWVVFATEDYLPLLEVAIAGIHTFSTRPVVAVGVNVGIPFSTEKYPRMFKKRIDVDVYNRHPLFYKPQAILAADLEHGIYLDADALVNIGCDYLFEEARRVKEFPLLPRHEDEAYVLWDTSEFFEVKRRSMHYVHCDVIVYSKKCLPFLQEWAQICLDYPWLGNPVWDETLMNVLLWKKEATEQLYICDPYNAYFVDYLKLSKEAILQPPYDKWFMFHGNKDVERGWQMLEALKLKHHIGD